VLKDFTLREVEAFASVMQHGTVTKAADFLDIAQPGVSKLLAQFEAKAGFLVFHRHKKRLVPTPEAFTLYAEVERTFNSVRQITKVARDISDLRIGRLKIGLLPAMGSGVMPAIIYSFLGRHPEVRATVNVRSTQTLVEWAGRNQIDLAIGVSSQIENPAVVRRQLPPVPIVCVMARNHPFASLDLVTLEVLAKTDFVSLLPSDPLSIQIEQHAAIHEIRLSSVIETNLAATAIAFAAFGAGVAVVDYLSAKALPLNGLVVRRFEPALAISYSIYRQRGGKPSALATALSEYVIREFARILDDSDVGHGSLFTL
jgi:DNA-binding transcriptional LysR family regulator